MVVIKDISGLEHEIKCIACSIQSGEIALPVERIAETKYFVAEQDFENPIEGFVIIASKRHVKSISDFTEDEQIDFVKFLSKCRIAMKEKLNIEEVTLIQEERSSSSHFHMWLFPWLPSMLEYKKTISSILIIMKKFKEENINETELLKIKESTKKLKEFFINN